ncbi:PREDICTED: pentatricopeptide repeat-containing protein At4g18840 [Tarenaya hassleriana]|uniref:pentatricopeptide repeat-containing protein At4g18840 n=1 Tax=Tarenaya hassleriana TaxID=28532 RepID=UPI00053C3E56|nr:PREDICTED: pentatricopeptide repeat-containing protein At4g18840 [Tarenaya hassleriana]XP_010529217.1 PREDICTED: pentatricopeptide repeat-containing protein At4g18840 [Tarenaya hassleriana]XP_010529218.1 PREDICTED: pentatricopeptide repeat-containing protein At4g18840 [Tarenaya hassleriana]XP_010529219.1 PREDICTED: pentatricopeptide repeat-containing protein At4g18840 [Tarenaya hassleriana]XP_010529220.1 PREDICTED: pentatricopeptide repeat-containing protein At4g18840 [Tarenaya hassleriana]
MSACSSSSSILSFTEKAESLSEIQQAHAYMLKTGIFRDAFSASKLIAFSAVNPDPVTVSYARSILRRVENPNSFSYNSVIRAYANSSTPETALDVFREMLLGPVLPDKYSFTFVLKACAGFEGYEEGRQIHGLFLKTGTGPDVFVENTLVNVYGRSGHFELAHKVLDKMPERDAVSWNSLLSVYLDKGLVETARELFDEMEERNLESWNFMISGYMASGLVKEAAELFDAMPCKDVVSWNVMVTGYAHAGLYSEVLELFREILNSEDEPDGCTLVNVLSACANLGALNQGEWVHVHIDKQGIIIDGFLATALVDMYSKCGKIDKALEVFRATLRKDVSTWNSMISGLSIHGFGKVALGIFSEMLLEGFEPNNVTFVGVLSACSHAGLLDEGRELFGMMKRVYGIEPTVEHYGCMVDLFGRMGKVEEAEELVSKIPPESAPVLLESLLGACKRFGHMEMAERIAMRLVELNPEESSGYVQMSNLYASSGRWDEVMEVRRKMRAKRLSKKPGCSMIEVDGIVHEFLAGEGLIADEI